MLQIIVDWLVYSLLGLEGKLAESVNFFVYDLVKIGILLFLMIAVVGFLRSYIPQKKIQKWLTGTKKGLGNLVAASFGAITPFCSCSSIPIFLGFLEAGIPLGIAFSFLIASPLINEYLVVLMLGFFGWKITVAYIVSGLVIAVVVGWILGRMKLEKYLVKDLISGKLKEKVYRNLKERARFGLQEAWSIVKKIWIWLIVGIGLGAVIHNYVPQEWIQSLIGQVGWLSVPIAVVLGVPMYGSCAAIVPIAVVLFQKGISLGTALAFMMATAALSLPEAVILRRVMKLKLILIFFGVVTLGIVVIGYLFNLLQVVWG